MRDDPASRILSVSFKRDRHEHAMLMMEVGKKLVRSGSRLQRWTVFIGSLVLGLLAGPGMEAYRIFVLVPIFGIDAVPPVNIVLLEMLPLLLLLLAVVYGCRVLNRRRGMRAIEEKMSPDLFIDVDLYTDGIGIASGPVTVALEWPMIRSIIVQPERIDIESDSYNTYLPRRAFKTQKDFDDAGKQFEDRWQRAQTTAPNNSSAQTERGELALQSR